jgi:hypothetical protein
VNAPLTLDGEQFWSAFRASSNQIRALGPMPIGFDYAALAALAAAKGCPPASTAEFFSEAERVALGAIHAHLREHDVD